MDERKPAGKEPDRHGEDEDDRRGEHQYPPDPDHQPTASQRERDALKARLEKRS